LELIQIRIQDQLFSLFQHFSSTAFYTLNPGGVIILWSLDTPQDSYNLESKLTSACYSLKTGKYAVLKLAGSTAYRVVPLSRYVIILLSVDGATLPTK